MMSEYYSKEELISILKVHILPEYQDKVNWDKIINDGEIYPHDINNISGTYIYDVDCIEGWITVFVHPMICIEVFYDPFQRKEKYMNGTIARW